MKVWFHDKYSVQPLPRDIRAPEKPSWMIEDTHPIVHFRRVKSTSASFCQGTYFPGCWWIRLASVRCRLHDMYLFIIFKLFFFLSLRVGRTLKWKKKLNKVFFCQEVIFIFLQENLRKPYYDLASNNFFSVFYGISSELESWSLLNFSDFYLLICSPRTYTLIW